MKSNRIIELMRMLNFCEINGHAFLAAIFRAELAEAMAPVVTAHPFPLAT